jgi:hypothetical protein
MRRFPPKHEKLFTVIPWEICLKTLENWAFLTFLCNMGWDVPLF